MKIVNIELLVRAIELLEAYQVGSISPEKLDVNTNKLIKDFEKEYPDLAREIL
jgi:hypothetical protein|tara:strand:- start:197 stop:355 length:159 start_codon:yes stop_codon:yes gene_type:complete